MTIYRRGLSTDGSGLQTFVLSWCCAGRRQKDRVVGDKFEAVRRADEIKALLRAGTARPRPGSLGVVTVSCG